MGRILKERDVEAAVKGGSVYAAGGGGWADHGRMLGYAAVSVGKPELVDIEELDPKDWVATAAAIGAPASTKQWEMRGVDYIKAVELLAAVTDAWEPQESLTVLLTPEQARDFVPRARHFVQAGRPPCPFCQQPISATGHICPRADGYRRLHA